MNGLCSALREKPYKDFLLHELEPVIGNVLFAFITEEGNDIFNAVFFLEFLGRDHVCS